MEELISLIPNSIVSLIGLAVVMGVLVMLGTLFQEWGKALYRKVVIGNREKRQGSNHDYNGIERRADGHKFEHAIIDLLAAMKTNNEQFSEFISAWKEAQFQMGENINSIKRKQDANWKRLFEEELPHAWAKKSNG